MANKINQIQRHFNLLKYIDINQPLSKKYLQTTLLLSLVLLSSGCLNKSSQPVESNWDQVLTVQMGDQPFEINGEPFKIGLRYEDDIIETSEGHVLHRNPVSTDKNRLKKTAGSWFEDRGYFASTYGSTVGDGEIGSWIFTGVPLDSNKYRVINPTPGTKGYKYFSTGLYTGTLQEFDTRDDGKIDVWAVTLRESPLQRNGQLEYIWRDEKISRIGIEYQSMTIKASTKLLKNNGINLKLFKSPWRKDNRKK